MSDEVHSRPESDNAPELVHEILAQESAGLAAGNVAVQRPQGPAERSVFTPPIDIYEDENGLVLYADLPGVTTDTLELQVQDNKLTLFGRVAETVDPCTTALHREYDVGDFLRSFILSEEVDHERITASLNNGVLKIVLPKAEHSPARNIPIQTD
jgi:HSP20 family molecular chaperone IbpA